MIDKDVQKEEWYNDSNATRLFLHLAFNALYADGAIYKQRQCKFTVSELSSKLSISTKQVRTAIAKLEKFGVIETKTEKLKSSGTIFTLLKHVNFAKNTGANEMANERANEISLQNNQNQDFTNQICDERANERANERAILIENNNLNNINNNILCVNTREDEKKWFAQMKRQFTAWQADACRVLRIDQATLATYIEDFEVECRAKSATHVSWQNISSHFIDWTRRQVEKQQIKQQKNYGSNQAKYDPTDSYEPKSTRENYFL